MVAVTRRVAVLTVGLNPRVRSQLGTQLAEYAEIDLQHFDAWTFRLLEADIVVLNLEQEGGQDARDMLRSFRGTKALLEVTYSESEERMRVWSGVHPISGRVTGQESAPRFSRRLQDALRKAGCYEVVLEDLAEDRRVVAGDAAKPGVDSGIRWTD